MDSKRYSGNWEQHAGSTGSGPPTKRSSMRRYPEQPAYTMGGAAAAAKRASGGDDSIDVKPQASGSSRSNSHLRRESGGYIPHQAYQPAAARPANGRTMDGKSYAARLQAQPGLEDQIYRSQTKRPDYDDPVSPTSPADRVAFSKDLLDQKYGRRRSSVPDRSPLQKLEVTLDDISKEEKRARVAEAETAAQTRTGREPKRSRGSVLKAKGYVPGVIDPYAQAQRASGQRVSSDPTGSSQRPESGRQPVNSRQSSDPASGSINPPRGYVTLPADTSAQSLQSAPRQYNGGSEHRRSLSGTQPYSAWPADARLSTEVDPSDQTPRVAQPSSGRAPAASVGAIPVAPAVAAARSNSRKLQKQSPAGQAKESGADIGLTQLQSERTGKVFGISAARRAQEPDILPPGQVASQQGSEGGPTYEAPPQTAAGAAVRQQVGFGPAQGPQVQGSGPQSRQRLLGGIFHHEPGPDRRYQAGRPLDEWRSAQTASLVADDLNLANASTQDRSQAWWEKNEQQRRRSSGSKAVAFEGNTEAGSGRQTYFQPPLYLKCGPLLRYCGIQTTQPTKGGIREVWRGSVLIVTDDTRSNTQSAPVLRLFAQPRELIPPPPLELNLDNGLELAPEYVDPLAGQVHMSRIGKTLYVRPVEALPENDDLSRLENDNGLFEEKPSAPPTQRTILNTRTTPASTGRDVRPDGERIGKYREVKAIRLYNERNTTFWRFNIEVELGRIQTRIAYRINNGPEIGFWVPARGDTMNIMFHSCNGFSLSVDSNEFCGPDPMWRDVMNCHQTKPFHVMIGGGDQIYNDAATRHTQLFREWCEARNPHYKHSAPFTVGMQNELEDFYLDRYALWFSQGLFGMANAQIPMVNMWDDHDIMDGFGSYPHHFMSTPVFTGVGAVAFKYYMLFQHQSIPDETEKEEPSWLLGGSPGPYIEQLSRSLFMFLGRKVAFVGLDCRTERMKDEVLSQETYDLVFERLRREIVKGETQHLIVLLGVPIAYPRLNFLENVLTSRAMDPVKALGRLGLFGNFLNKFDGGVEILDDLDDHWTAKHHKDERNWFIQELQELAAEKSVRVSILGGDVHLAAVGQFFSNKKLGIPKDRDHRYMPNIISSAIVNTPPPELMGDILNKRNKIHHLDRDTDENMIPLFTHDVDGKPRNNHHLLPRRNWCAIREYAPGQTPPPTPPMTPSIASEGKRRLSLTRSLSWGRKDSTNGINRRLTRRGTGENPPRSFFNTGGGSQSGPRRASDPSISRPNGPAISRPTDNSTSYFSGVPPGSASDPHPRPNPFHRVPTGLSEKAMLRGAAADVTLDQHIDLQHGLDIVLNLEVNQHDPSGITTPYRLLIPTLTYEGEGDVYNEPRKVGLGRWLSQKVTGARKREVVYDSEEDSNGGFTPGQRASGQYTRTYLHEPQATAGAPNNGGPPPPPPQRASYQQPQVSQEQGIPPQQRFSSGEPGIGSDGRPVRKQYRDDLYGEIEPARYGRDGPGGMAEDGFSDGEEGTGRRQVSLSKRIMGSYRDGGKEKRGWKIWK